MPARSGDPYCRAEPKVKGGFSLGDQGNSYVTEFKNK